MDSMRSLNTSLPAAYSSRQPPPEQLLQAFKTAALSVTNLYKSAVADQSNSRAAGYQDALDDLMKFLDQENLGLQDGEGWRVRQWVSERYDGTANQPHTDAEDERLETGPRARSAPPSGNQLSEPQAMQQDQAAAEHSTDNQLSTGKTAGITQPEPVFQFTAGGDGTQTDGSRATSTPDAPSPPIRVEVINRGSRTPYRASQRHSTRSSNRDFTFTSGTKRKLQFPDFFDIANVGTGDGSGVGSKRGRFA